MKLRITDEQSSTAGLRTTYSAHFSRHLLKMDSESIQSRLENQLLKLGLYEEDVTKYFQMMLYSNQLEHLNLSFLATVIFAFQELRWKMTPEMVEVIVARSITNKSEFDSQDDWIMAKRRMTATTIRYIRHVLACREKMNSDEYA